MKPTNGWFHPKELVGFWMVLVGFWMVFFDVSPSFSENEKGVFSGSLGRLFSGRMKIHIPFDDFSPGISRK